LDDALLRRVASSRGAPKAAPKFPKGIPKGWAVVDADTGRVVASGGARVALPPASLSKVLTALVVVGALKPDTPVPVSRRAAAAPPSRVGMAEGQTWRTEDALRAMLLTSANDAALALAEKSGGGSLSGFQQRLADLAKRLGLADRPVLRDPAGLDDSASVGGGNLISARDLAIVARAALAQPRIASIVKMREYRFKGPDGKQRRLVNHNKLLKTYRGMVGMKTGFTKKAGGCLLTAATRNGRTMVAVVLGVRDIYGSSKALLDLGFGLRPKDQPRADVLPRVLTSVAPAPAAPAKPKPKPKSKSPSSAPTSKPKSSSRSPATIAPQKPPRHTQ
jgi:D-alanyl-D-alanine carboxypeptidase (penicillin-binding protein 5/6)